MISWCCKIKHLLEISVQQWTGSRFSLYKWRRLKRSWLLWRRMSAAATTQFVQKKKSDTVWSLSWVLFIMSLINQLSARLSHWTNLHHRLKLTTTTCLNLLMHAFYFLDFFFLLWIIMSRTARTCAVWAHGLTVLERRSFILDNLCPVMNFDLYPARLRLMES